VTVITLLYRKLVLIPTTTSSYSSPLPDEQDLDPTTTTAPSSTTSSTTISATTVDTHSHSFTSVHHIRPSIIPRPYPTHGFPTFSPQPTPTSPVPSRPRGQSLTAIVFEVLGGLIGLGLALCVIRCVYIYKRTPERDRIAAFVSRHRLEREMDELAHRALRPSITECRPPPPYFPPPPSYEGEEVTGDG
jgi:hypothetical protein